MDTILEYIEEVMLPRLDRDRAERILSRARGCVDGYGAQHRAITAARMNGIEAEAIEASERLRAASWDTIWDSTQTEAWLMSWVMSRVGLAIATIDHVGDGHYQVQDYLDLIDPFSAGFPDFPIPTKE